MSGDLIIDCDFTDDLVCPYCGHAHADDGEMNESGEAQCYMCEKHFKFEVEYSKSFSSRQVPCLNGGEHQWKDVSYPAGFYEWVRRCRACEMYQYGPRIPKTVTL